MRTWQRLARLLIAVAAVVFAIVVALAFRPRAPQQTAAPVVPTDPKALVESATGLTIRMNREKEHLRVEYDKLLAYGDGATKMLGMKVTTERSEGRTFVITGAEGEAQKDQSTFEVAGDVKMASGDGLVVQTERATYLEQDGIVRGSGPVKFSQDGLSGTGIGFTYDENLDVLTLLDDALVRVAPGRDGADGAEITAGLAEFGRGAQTMRFEGAMKVVRGDETIEADNGVAQLAGEDDHLERLELRGNARIRGSKAVAGGLQAMSGRDIDLEYGGDGRTLQHATVTEKAVILLFGDEGAAGRRIAANEVSLSVASDGATLVDLRARTGVRLVIPGQQGGTSRTIDADRFDADGEEGKGLTSGLFRGNVTFREQGPGVDRTGQSGALNVTLGAGLGEIHDARFSGSTKFVDGAMTATAASATYALGAGTLELRPGDSGGSVPRLVNERLVVEGLQIDVTLAGPLVKASGSVKSELKPQNGPVPSMLKADQPVIVVSDHLLYDGSASKATYDGSVRLSQGDTSIKAGSIVLDEKRGDLGAAGAVVTTTVLEQTTDGRRERVPSIARAERFAYEESLKRATYTTNAQVGGPHGEMRAAKIELYLRPSGNELERVEAYEDVVLLEQRRKTTGTRLSYFSEDNRYVVIGTPVTIIDECTRETIGRTLTFYQNTDRIVVDGNEQIRTKTTGTSQCS
jgi:LPS export ABC transporter protein LptC/lipopolysaccharide transport protein LptA